MDSGYLLRKHALWRIIAPMEQRSGVIPEFRMCDRLRRAREMTGLDQGPFAELIGVSRGTVSNYERHEVWAFRPIVLRAWAMATGVPLEWLMHGDKAPDGDKTPTRQTAGTGRRKAGDPSKLPRLDSNQQPSGYMYALVRSIAA